MIRASWNTETPAASALEAKVERRLPDQPRDDTAEALARIADQLEQLPGRLNEALKKPAKPRRPVFGYMDPDLMLSAIGIDPEKQLERQKVQAEIKALQAQVDHLKTQRRWAWVTGIAAALSAVIALAAFVVAVF
jgi:hypothetical protein